MTVQEENKQDVDIAISHMQVLKDWLGDSLTQKSFKESIDVAIESMEKQIPKKPLKVKGECYSKTKDGKEYYEVILLCPNCKEQVLVNPFPCKCGQLIDFKDISKLDWEEGGTSE